MSISWKRVIVGGIASGLVATVAMDVGNWLTTTTGITRNIDYSAIGRVTEGWFKGVFFYASPKQVADVSAAWTKGLISHYTIGAIFGLLYLLVAEVTRRDPRSWLFGIGFGLLTSVASLFFLFPSLGLGAMGLKAGTAPMISSLINHAFFGVGLAAGAILVGRFLDAAPASGTTVAVEQS